MCTQLDIFVEDAFRNQLCSNIDIKLREFNFKVKSLSGLLVVIALMCMKHCFIHNMYESDINGLGINGPTPQ